MDNIAEDLLSFHITKVVPLREHKLMETVFKTQLQYISSEIQAYLAITQLIPKRLSTAFQSIQNTKVLNTEGLIRI